MCKSKVNGYRVVQLMEDANNLALKNVKLEELTWEKVKCLRDLTRTLMQTIDELMEGYQSE